MSLAIIFRAMARQKETALLTVRQSIRLEVNASPICLSLPLIDEASQAQKEAGEPEAGTVPRPELKKKYSDVPWERVLAN